MNQGMKRLEFRQLLNQYKPIGDEQTTMIEDSGGGQVIRSLRTQGVADGVNVFNIEPYWFIASILNETYVKVTDGYFVHGSTVEYVGQDFPLISELSTGFLSLVAYYRLFTDPWSFEYESSAGFPVQTPFVIDSRDNPAERFPIAYIDFTTEEVTQINLKEIRTTRVG